MLGVPLLVREGLNLPHARIRTIDETTARARLERNVRRNHISGVGKIEAVEGFDQVTRYVVNMDTAAALSGAGVRLRDKKEPVYWVEFDVGAAVELVHGAGEWLRKPRVRCKVVKLHAEVDFGGRTRGAGGWVDRETIDVAKPDTPKFAEGASGKINRRDEPRHERVSQHRVSEHCLVGLVIVGKAGVAS